MTPLTRSPSTTGEWLKPPATIASGARCASVSGVTTCGERVTPWAIGSPADSGSREIAQTMSRSVKNPLRSPTAISSVEPTLARAMTCGHLGHGDSLGESLKGAAAHELPNGRHLQSRLRPCRGKATGLCL